MTRMSTFLKGHWPKSTEGFEIEEEAGWINTIDQETEGTELGPKSICFGSGALILLQSEHEPSQSFSPPIPTFQNFCFIMC